MVHFEDTALFYWNITYGKPDVYESFSHPWNKHCSRW